MSGLGGAFEGIGKGYGGLIDTMQKVTPQRAGSGDGGMQMVIALIGLLIPMFNTMMQQSNERWQAVVDGKDRTYGEILSDLRREIQERSGPSHFDTIAHGMVNTMFQTHMQQMTAPPKDRVTALKEALGEIEELSGLTTRLRGNQHDYSPDRLAWEGLQIEREDKAGDRAIRLEEAKGKRAMWTFASRRGPETAVAVLDKIFGTLGIGTPSEAEILGNLGGGQGAETDDGIEGE